MDNSIEPLNDDFENFEVRRQLITELKELLKIHLSTGKELDEKAWDIVRFSGAVFGAAIAIITLNNVSIDTETATNGLALALFIQGLQFIFLWRAVKPERYIVPPGTPNEFFTYEEFREIYIEISEGESLEQTIVDYVGDGIDRGAIQIAQTINQEKTKHIHRITYCLIAMMITLVITLILAIE